MAERGIIIEIVRMFYLHFRPVPSTGPVASLVVATGRLVVVLPFSPAFPTLNRTLKPTLDRHTYLVTLNRPASLLRRASIGQLWTLD